VRLARMLFGTGLTLLGLRLPVGRDRGGLAGSPPPEINHLRVQQELQGLWRA